MQNKKFKLLINILIIIVVFGAGYFLIHDYNKNAWKRLPLNTTPGFPYGGGGDISTEIENQIKSLFDGWMKEQGGFSEYTVNFVHRVILKSEAQKEDLDFYFPMQTTNDAYIASVNFSVKASDTQAIDFWKAGNGDVESDDSLWVREKVLLLTIDIVDDNYKIINIGTGF